MGREIRRVPQNWEHPKTYQRHGLAYQPLYERSYKTDSDKWVVEFLAWQNGTAPGFAEHGKDYPYYWDWAGMPPDKSSYVSYDCSDKALCSWWQCYETVSEGTPVSPPFASAEELIDYLCTKGDFWEQNRARDEDRPVNLPSRESASRFVLGTGWAPSMVAIHRDGKSVIREGIDALEIM